MPRAGTHTVAGDSIVPPTVAWHNLELIASSKPFQR